MSKHLQGSSLAVLAASVLTCHASPSLAQETQQKSLAIDGGLGEIIVTARRREENIQSVPDTVTVYDSAAIESRNIQGLPDAINLTPNVSIVTAQDPGLSLISIRGVISERNTEPSVAVVIDGVQLVNQDRINQSLFDVERIEVLKGPQGALYGRNAIGGALVVTTKAPTNEFKGFVEAAYGNGDDRTITGSLRGPIIDDRLLFSVGGRYRDFDGLIPNVTQRTPADYSEDYDIRGRLIWKPLDTLSVDLRGSHGWLKGGASYYIPLPPASPNNTSVPVQADEPSFGERKLDEFSAKIDLDLDDMTITSVSAYSRTNFFLHEDLDWLPQTFLGIDQRRFSKSFSEELRVSSPSTGPLRWTVGAYLLDVKRILRTDLLFPLPGSSTLNGRATTAFPRENNLAYAFFGQLDYDISDRLNLTVAGRYDSDRRKQRDQLTGVVSRKTFDSFQPKFSLLYKWSPTFRTYATVARGFKSGGFNAPGPVFPLIFKPETTTNFEFGFKSELFDRKVRFNGAVFQTNYKNLQQFSLVQALQGLFNVDKVRIRGLELEAVAAPVDGLQLNAALGLLDPKIRKITTQLFVAPNVALFVPAQVVGNRVPKSYSLSLSIGAQYSFDIGAANISMRADYETKRGNYWHIDNLDREKARHLVNATVKATIGKFSITGYADNLFNRKYTEEFFAQEWLFLFSDIRFPGRPRSYGARLRYDF
jgi:iron complex outermembrane receptor protein